MPPPAQSPRILIVDDDEGLLILMAGALRAEGYDVATADSGRAALAWLDQHTPTLMLLDLKMRDVDGPALLEKLQQGDTPVPFVIVTGQGDEKVAVEVMKRGALDYVMKNTALLDLLPGVVKRTLNKLTQEKALAAAETEFVRLEKEVIAAGERERHNIGADLHDGLGQQLTAIEFMCAALKADLAAVAPELGKQLEQISGMLREAVAQTRLLSHGLVPVGHSPDALQNSLAEMAERTNRVGRLQCRFECRKPVLLPDPAVAGHLYRIAQEAINNAMKHASAKRATIRMEGKSGSLTLEISDDGCGISSPRGSPQGHGLGIMQHRAGVIGATLSVQSKRGEGTVIRCTLPLKS